MIEFNFFGIFIFTMRTKVYLGLSKYGHGHQQRQITIKDVRSLVMIQGVKKDIK